MRKKYPNYVNVFDWTSIFVTKKMAQSEVNFHICAILPFPEFLVELTVYCLSF